MASQPDKPLRTTWWQIVGVFILIPANGPTRRIKGPGPMMIWVGKTKLSG
jgi:hypothetical protein